MKIIFMGTPDFAIPALKELLENKDHEVVAVFTAPPRPKGRGMKLQKSQIHTLAEENGIEVHTPKSLRKGDAPDIINSIDADIIVVVAYGFIIPKNILEAKKHGVLNIHPSKLPKYRGAAPLQRTVINGDKETAICIMQMDEGLDTGDVIMQQDMDLPADITLQKLHDDCAEIGAKLLIKTLDNITTLPRTKQSEQGLVYAEKLSKDEGRIDWNRAAYEIDCKVRGMNPWPGCYFDLGEQEIKILRAKIVERNSEEAKGENPGTILNEKFDVVCGSGILRLLEVKPSGKRAMSGEDYLRGAKRKCS